jgi:hypothetical protein
MVAAGRLAGRARAGTASQPGFDGGRTDEQEKIPPLDRHRDTLPRVAGLGPGSAATSAGWKSSPGTAPDTALRLSRYFGTSERFWLNLQARYDLETEKDRLGAALDDIRPLAAAS